MFSLGRIVYTQGVAAKIEDQTLTKLDLLQLIFRHKSGDWGNLCQEDKDTNSYAVKHNERIFSSYIINGIKLYVITEWDRSITTVLLPQEY
ncbi:hypothetical protein [Ruminiclostridium josui]|uniref:hypothetical protein n=1 Tax=Ruminiclostridium josui TaxID=1499 RepID=UPI000463DE2D|nr:hypothetical protein [Ruminiclostridium josui]